MCRINHGILNIPNAFCCFTMFSYTLAVQYYEDKPGKNFESTSIKTQNSKRNPIESEKKKNQKFQKKHNELKIREKVYTISNYLKSLNTDNIVQKQGSAKRKHT